MYEKLEVDGGFRYVGSVFGFNFEIEKEDDDAFETWLTAKLSTYLLSDIETNVLKELLGIKSLEDRVTALES